VHDEAHVRVDLRDAGIVTECGEMSIGWSTWVTILVGSGMLTGTTMLSPNGKPTAIGNMWTGTACAPAWSAEVRAAQLHVQQT
jgi:hypothetical protein